MVSLVAGGAGEMIPAAWPSRRVVAWLALSVTASAWYAIGWTVANLF